MGLQKLLEPQKTKHPEILSYNNYSKTEIPTHKQKGRENIDETIFSLFIYVFCASGSFPTHDICFI